MPNPVKDGVALQHFPVQPFDVSEKSRRIGIPLFAGGYGLLRIEVFDDSGGIAGRYGVGRHIIDYNRTGTDDAVCPQSNTLADNGAVSDPYIRFDVDRLRFADGNAVVYVVPIAVGDIGMAGDHTAVFNHDLGGRPDANTRTEHAIVTDTNAPLSLDG